MVCLHLCVYSPCACVCVCDSVWVGVFMCVCGRLSPLLCLVWMCSVLWLHSHIVMAFQGHLDRWTKRLIDRERERERVREE